MKEHKGLIKKVLLGLYGVLQGFFGSWWLLISIAAIFPQSVPGDKDYDEDRWFVPFGFGMLLLWLAVMAVTIFLNRKDKAHLLSFLLPWAVGTGGLLLWGFLWH